MTTYIHHTKEEDYTPLDAQNELMELIVKAGRRCAYDLRHAADFIPASEAEFRDIMYARAAHWLKVFNPGDDHKNYRHHLHMVIMNRDALIEQLIKRCEDNGINVEDLKDSDIPF